MLTFPHLSLPRQSDFVHFVANYYLLSDGVLHLYTGVDLDKVVPGKEGSDTDRD